MFSLLEKDIMKMKPIEIPKEFNRRVFRQTEKPKNGEIFLMNLDDNSDEYLFSNIVNTGWGDIVTNLIYTEENSFYINFFINKGCYNIYISKGTEMLLKSAKNILNHEVFKRLLIEIRVYQCLCHTEHNPYPYVLLNGLIKVMNILNEYEFDEITVEQCELKLTHEWKDYIEEGNKKIVCQGNHITIYTIKNFKFISGKIISGKVGCEINSIKYNNDGSREEFIYRNGEFDSVKICDDKDEIKEWISVEKYNTKKQSIWNTLGQMFSFSHKKAD